MTALRFDDRVAVITGGGRGLGRAYARLLASRGARVVINDTGGARDGKGVDAGPAESVVREIEALGSGGAVACVESVATAQGGRAIVQAALDHYGRLDILIHSAGNVRWGSLTEMTPEDFDAVLDVHLRGAFHVTRAAFPIMAKARYGRVVLTSSIDGLYGDTRLANYAAAKAGTVGLANIVALEGAECGVKCNVILPGALTRMAEGADTSGFPPMSPEMVAPVVAWLAHESCAISGEMLISIAGRVARAYLAETVGLYKPTWSIEDVAERMDTIRRADPHVVIPVLPSGHREHMRMSFEMAQRGKRASG